jgi:hypothetical protein
VGYEAPTTIRTPDTTRTQIIIWENDTIECNYKFKCRVGVWNRHWRVSTPGHA